MDCLERLYPLFPDLEQMNKQKILLLGLGGVGGYCLDCLHRSGFRDITAVDFDKFEVSNQNRQILSQYVDEYKAEVFAREYEGIKPIVAKIDEEWVESFDFEPYAVVIDAIDDMSAKVAVVKKAHDKLISSMGSAKKIDPTKIRVESIWNTTNDPLAKRFRHRLRKAGFTKELKVVYSNEHSRCEELGSFVAVTGAFGLTLCSLAVRKIEEILLSKS